MQTLASATPGVAAVGTAGHLGHITGVFSMVPGVLAALLIALFSADKEIL